MCILAMQRPDVIACLSNKRAHFREKKVSAELSFLFLSFCCNELACFFYMEMEPGQGPLSCKIFEPMTYRLHKTRSGRIIIRTGCDVSRKWQPMDGLGRILKWRGIFKHDGDGKRASSAGLRPSKRAKRCLSLSPLPLPGPGCRPPAP
jgi:hypothetical protein